MIRRIIQLLFSSAEIKTADDYQKDFDALCERAHREAVASVSRGNVNLVSGGCFTEQNMQKRCVDILSKLHGL